MMRWRPWPPLLARKFQVKLVVRRLEAPPSAWKGSSGAVAAEVAWKGPKAGLGSLRRPAVRRNCTREALAVGPPSTDDGGGEAEAEAATVVEWKEEFHSVCCLTAHKEKDYHPWEIAFTVYESNGLNHGPRNKMSIIGTASLNLAIFASAAEEKEIEINIPLSMPGVSSEPFPTLHLSLSLLELRTAQVYPETAQRSLEPVPLSPTPTNDLPPEKDELSALKAGLRKVKILTEFVSTRKSKKTCREDEDSEGRCSARSEDTEYTNPFDIDSLGDDLYEGELDDEKENSIVRKSFSYGTLASANYVEGSFYSEMRIDGECENWIHYGHRTSDAGTYDAHYMLSSNSEQPLQTTKRIILPWKKRKLSFRSPKAKGEPLLKKAYEEEGGDDIDFDRRQLSSTDESMGWHREIDCTVANCSYASEFGDDNFAVGSWETKEIGSRDGHMKLCTKVFFASIDQRSERAAGESACTALVAVIADWLQSNKDTMPIKSQFDGLIREGSLEWRNLCENTTYQERFPDKHFDLETVLQAKIRPLSVVPGKSFIGFFHPEAAKSANEDNSAFEFLHGSMSFDNIWDEISRAGSEFPSGLSQLIYIVSWNDHFFVLKIGGEAYYIIDTLGERLYEGCNQAYILKFDESTTILKVSGEEKQAAGITTEAGNQVQQNVVKNSLEGPAEPHDHISIDKETELVVCSGKETCKEYIKSFLAAIPIRELQTDVRKGLAVSTPIHHRLQIEFHYTEPSKKSMTSPHLEEAILELPELALESAAAFSLPPANAELGLAVV